MIYKELKRQQYIMRKKLQRIQMKKYKFAAAWVSEIYVEQFFKYAWQRKLVIGD